MDSQALLSIIGVAAVALLGVVIGVRRRARHREKVRRAAARLYADARAVYTDEPAYRVVSPEDIPGLGREGYRLHDELLRAGGFGPLAAVENLTLSRIHPEHRTCIAFHLSADRRTVASTWRLQDRQYLQVGANTHDARFLLTSNAEPNLLYWPPTIDHCILPADTPPSEVLSRHRSRTAAFEQKDPAVEWVAHDGMDSVLAASHTLWRAVGAHRRHIGYLTLEELLAQARHTFEEQAARRLWAEIQRLKQQEA